jgi:hypothetical protein
MKEGRLVRLVTSFVGKSFVNKFLKKRERAGKDRSEGQKQILNFLSKRQDTLN